MHKLFHYFLVFLFAVSASSVFAASSQAPIKAVASFSILADWVRQVGGEHVEVLSLVGLDEDVHVYQASPADLRKVADADVMFVNGLNLEGWLERLIDTSGFQGRLVVLSDGIDVIDSAKQTRKSGSKEKHADHEAHDDHEGHEEHEGHEGHEEHVGHHEHDHGSLDPHAWLSPKMARIYVSKLGNTLISLSDDLAVKKDIERKTEDYLSALTDLDVWIHQQLKPLPVERRNVVVPHNAFAYFARDYHLSFHSLQGSTSESESSAAAFASVVRKIRLQNITSIFGENTGNSKLIERVAAEANLPLAGLLVSGALSRELAPTYLDMMRYNATLLLRSLRSE